MQTKVKLTKLLDGLGWPHDITLQDAKLARRRALSEAHPDRPGGDDNRFRLVLSLSDQVIDQLIAQVVGCHECNDTGKVRVKGGFGVMTTVVCNCRVKKRKPPTP